MKRNKYFLLFIYVASLGLFLSDSARAQTTILHNNKIRMGNGSESSVNASGNLQQPFYYNSVQATWRKLTYSVYPLDNAFGVGGDKTNVWNLNGTVVQNPTLSNQVVDRTGFVATNGNKGYGTVISKGTIQLGGQNLEVQNTYRMPESSGYIEVKVKVKNVSAAPLENVRIWIGTQDDWVGNTDGPLKEKGNLVDGAFERITNAATRSAALKISTKTEGILLYTNSDRGNTIINGCCSWGNVINQNPESSVIQITHDGSYGFYVRLNDLPVGDSDEFTWYYAAGVLSDIDNIIREVASVSAAFAELSSSDGAIGATSTVPATGYWMVVPHGSTPPTAAQIIAGVEYDGVTPTSHGSEAMAANEEVEFQLSGLSPATEYDFYFVAVNGESVRSEVLDAEFATSNPEITSEPVLAVNEDAVYSYTITAVDTNDPSDVLTFSASVIPSWLTIDEETGLLTGIPTNEFVGDNDVTVHAFDGTVYVDQSFVIVVSNTNDVPIVINEGTFTLAENSVNGISVGTLFGHDDDLETTFRTWTIVSGNVNNTFAIDPDTGEITIADSTALDFKPHTSFELVVTVSDGIAISAEQTIAINLTDVNEVPVIAENQVLTVDENSASEVVAGTVLASDPDEASTLMGWTIVDGNTNEAFSIDPVTGVITVSNPEALNFETLESFELTIMVTDGELTSSPETVTIYLTNLNDNNPVITANQSFSLDENTAAGFMVSTLAATDADGETTYSNWGILEGNIDDAFSIDPLTGEISVNNQATLDFEGLTSYTLSIAVSDGVNTSELQTFVININNLNDVRPVISTNITFSVDENKAHGFAVGTITATDEDGETTFSSWSIVSGNTNNTFRIDPLTGVITVENASALNFEATSVYTLVIAVSDGINTSLTQTVVIQVNDLNEIPVVAENQMFELMENSPNGLEIGVAVASDPDGTTTFTDCTIVSQNESGVFEMDHATGKIRLKNNTALDFETQPTHTLWITVSDGHGVSIAVVITINLIDVPENANGNPIIFTAFSPNGDGVNDTWNIPNLNSYPDCEMKVFNSDGMELFYNKGYTRQWDGTHQGKEMPLGTYYYLVRLNDTSNTVYKGHFTLIR